MIIYRKYAQEEISAKTKTTLEAKLIFKREVAPIVKENIKDRMYGNYLLSNYLNEVEKIKLDDYPRNNYDRNLDKRRTLKIKERPLKFGIDIKISSFKDLNAEEMLDLDALNKYILTGEYPVTPKK